MPEQEARDGQPQEQVQQQEQGKTPPWERDGQEFNPETAWNLIQRQRGENDSLAKSVSGLQRQVESLRTANLTPDEKVLREAEQRGRSAALKESGQELARSAFDAAAGRRNPNLQESDLSEILEVVNLDKFVSEDGKVDQEAVRKAAERLVPTAEGRVPDLEGGHDGGASSSVDMSSRIRKMAGLGR